MQPFNVCFPSIPSNPPPSSSPYTSFFSVLFFFITPPPSHDRRFRSKYHPDEMERLAGEAHGSLQNRLNVFTFLMENNWLDNVSLDIDRAQAITKVLDAGKKQSNCGRSFTDSVLDGWFCTTIQYKPPPKQMRSTVAPGSVWQTINCVDWIYNNCINNNVL